MRSTPWFLASWLVVAVSACADGDVGQAPGTEAGAQPASAAALTFGRRPHVRPLLDCVDVTNPPLTTTPLTTPDAYVVKLAGATGATISARSYGDGLSQAATRVVTNRNGTTVAARDLTAVIVQSAGGTVDFGAPTAPLTAANPRSSIVTFK